MPFTWLENIDEDIKDTKQVEDIQEISDGIREYYMWPLLVLGVPGNILTIITLITMGKMTLGAFFIAVLAASDLAALLTKFIKLQVDIHDVYIGPGGCKMQFLPIYFSTLANWMLALIALERFISVCYPLQKAYLFTKKRSYIAVTVLVFSFLVIIVPIFVVGYTSTGNGNKCGAKYHYFWTKVWWWINACLVIFIPFILNLVFTICIIRGLHRSRQDRRRMLRKDEDGVSRSTRNNSKLLKETEKTERMLTIMLILASLIFLLLALPACIYFLAKEDEYEDPVEQARWNLFGQVQYMLFDSSHAINFFLYFLSARRFRTQFISILTCRQKTKAETSDASNHTDSSKLSATTTKI